MSTEFQTFEVSRTLAAPPGRVFAAWTDPASKRRWFAEGNGPDWETLEYEADIRVGGTERGAFGRAGGDSVTYEARYMDVVPDARLIYAYVMTSGGARISASLSTVTMQATGGGTRLLYTEQVVFLDGGDTLATRLPGTEHLLDKLAAAVGGQPGA